MRCEIEVEGLPPKKDGAASMWNKPVEIERIKRLREALCSRLNGATATTDASVRLHVTIWAQRHKGDLDNFITGICDAIQAAHGRTPVDPEVWGDPADPAHPSRFVTIRDDCMIDSIRAERRDPGASPARYRLVIEW